MAAFQNTTTGTAAIAPGPTRMRVLFSAIRYLAGKVATILVTIFVGIFITMMIVDVPADVGGGVKRSPFQMRLESEISMVVQVNINEGLIRRDQWGSPNPEQVEALTRRLRAEAGVDLPYLPRYLLWSYKALTFSWGELNPGYISQGQGIIARGTSSRPMPNPVLDYLPNTLLLVGTAYLLVFLIGMPFSLYLARHYAGWLDRLMTVLSPISSVPSWVFAMLLVTVFAVQLRWLPVAGMFDFHRPEEAIPYILTLLRHMVLPVTALVLSLLFQLVYTWRTFFIIYSEEDYVDLARAKGLETRLLEKQYILRPALPYIITSFATSLIGFWQLTVALEKIFQWPGIGMLYLEVLPAFWGETMKMGDLMIVVQIVVTFSYLLGILAILLDLSYVIVDPRIHLIPASNAAQMRVRSAGKRARGLFASRRARAPDLTKPVAEPKSRRSFSWDSFFRNGRESWREILHNIRLFLQQLQMYPSAIFGLVIITLLVVGSLYALFALPYEQIGADYDQNRSSGRNLRPRTAEPGWLNLFQATPFLSTLILDEKSAGADITTETLENGWVQKTVTFQFDYRYSEIPSDVFLYLDSEYSEKIPFVSLQWQTPDGRSIELRSKGVGGENTYDLQSGTFVRSLLTQHPEWKSWFETEGQYPTPAYKLLFAKPGAIDPEPLQGRYQLKITSLLFEEDSDIQSQLVLLGQVYGIAGTDYWRRDLIVPLLWGMPFTLVIGFLGTLITTLVAMFLPALGVWFGGALDTFIQRLTEMNMVLPGLAIAVLAYALHGVHIWIILGIVVVLNAFGSPIKSFRSAFLQAKEAPYMETARAYGASNFRIITRYLIPRILPVLVPHLVMQIPTFIFLEATLGFFAIRSTYPSWGRIIYEGLSRGALYGSPFWVLQPIFLLLLTGLAFAMLGLALERILNPRVISDVPVAPEKEKAPRRGDRRPPVQTKRLLAGLLLALVAFAVFIPSVQGKTLASLFISYLDPSPKIDTRIHSTEVPATRTPHPTGTSVSTTAPIVATQPSSTSMAPGQSTTPDATKTLTEIALTPTPTATDAPPAAYTLRRGEYPYCIARRFNIDPRELLALNGISNAQTFYTGMTLELPRSGQPFPGERRQRLHPATYTVSSSRETLYTVACVFGDVDPMVIAQANDISVDSALSIGQQLYIP